MDIIGFNGFLGKIEGYNVINDEELSFISKNFYRISKLDDFKEWSLKEENKTYVESIVKSENLNLEKEDDLLSYLMEINKHGNRFAHLFANVHLEYCSKVVILKYLEMIRSMDAFQNPIYNITFNNYLKISFVDKADVLDALKSGKFYAVKYLIEERKCDVNKKDNNGYTALHYASGKWSSRNC